MALIRGALIFGLAIGYIGRVFAYRYRIGNMHKKVADTDIQYINIYL